MAEHQLILSLGGNLGNKALIFQETSDLIENHIGKVTLLSPVYETPAWGFESEYPFWNRVLAVSTFLSPLDVLKEIRKIEKRYGRTRKPGVYLSRAMDIDILFYDHLILETEELTVPHPLIGKRLFVLAPLADILPGFIHPLTGKSILDILEECPDQSEIKRLSL